VTSGGATARTPTVSVCVPARNAGPYLAETLDSVFAQSLGPSEVIVCDNASSDDTPKISGRYATAGLRYHRFETLVGQAGNWNRCLDIATGDYVVLLHADDLLAPDFLRRALELHEAYPALAFVHCGVQFIDSRSRELSVRRLHAGVSVEPGRAFLRQLLTEGCLVNPAGVMIRASALRSIGRFSDRIEWGIDWHMWMRLCLAGDVGYLGEPLSSYRLHGGSGTAKVLARGRLAADELWAARDALSAAGLDGPEEECLARRVRYGVAHRAWCAAESACEEGQRRSAARGLASAVGTDARLLRERRTWGLALGLALGGPVYRWLRHRLGAVSPDAVASRPNG
jgi:glycosyltransferase involved in cell wall biosynthesis